MTEAGTRTFEKGRKHDEVRLLRRKRGMKARRRRRRDAEFVRRDRKRKRSGGKM